MRSLTDLLADPAGRAFLAGNGMHSDVDEFVEVLEPPEVDDLNTLLGLAAGTKVVHIGQQVCTDYLPATLTKFEVAPALAALPGVAPAILWHNADRADSEKFGMRIVLTFGSNTIGLPLASRALGQGEPRFITVKRSAVDDALEQMRRWTSGRNQNRPKPERQAAAERFDRLAAELAGSVPGTLDRVNARLAGFLMREGHDIDVRSAFLSDMLDGGLLSLSLNRYLERRDDVVAVFNETIADLLARDIDPHVKPLAPDYLPLHYNCPRTGRRMRLIHARDGAEHLASSECACGEVHSFPLGSSTLTIDALAATGRWSTDVSLPIHHNHIASGWIVGRSTAIYGMVLNAVATKVLGMRPIPGLIPPSLRAGATSSERQSLLAEYLTR